LQRRQRRVFDAGNDLDGPATFATDFNVDLERALAGF
jgi:hypothetical protein